MKKSPGTLLIAACVLLINSHTIKGQVITLTYTYTGAIQQVTLPATCGNVTIQARGAEGGWHSSSSVSSGLGADITGAFSFTPGTVLKILVGQQPSQTTAGNGGGGGSFVTYANNAPVLIAGGGGGSSGGTDSPAKHGQTGTSGGLGAAGGGVGGTNGSGGSIGASFASGAGGGLLTDGQTGWTTNTGGIAFINGGSATSQAAIGGFGGGGSGSAYIVGGGGGGYSGGGSGSNSSGSGVGGGGGSFNGGTNQINTGGSNSGHGIVIIKYSAGATIAVAATTLALCQGNSSTLTASGVPSFTWSPGGSNNSSIAVSPGTTTSYTVSGTNSLGCISHAVVTITVNTAAPAVTINTSTNNICLGKSVTLTATGGVAYTWNNGVTNGVGFVPAITTTYVVTASNGCGSNSAAVVVTVGPLPVTATANNTLVCQFNTSTLTASGGTSYAWVPGNQTSPSIVVAPSVNTIYTVTVSDGTCIGIAQLTVNTKPNPTITVIASSASICSGNSATITASGADTYTWNNSAITGSTGVVNPTLATNYVVTGTNAVGCISSTGQVVFVNPLPVVNAAVNPATVCSSSSASLIASGTANTFSWSTGTIGASDVVSPPVTSSYTLTGKFNSTGCFSTKVVTVNVSHPILNITPSSTTICYGTTVKLTAGPATNYSWSTGGGFSFIDVTPSVTTVYTVSALTTSNSIICPGTNSIEVIVLSKPTITASTTRSVMCRNEKQVLTATGAKSYTWSTGTQSASTTFTSNLINVNTVSVTGVDENGCADTAIVLIRVNTCTALEELTKQGGFKVYPNPSNGSLFVKTNESCEIYLTNQLGQLITILNPDKSSDFEVQLSELAPGVYFLTADSNGQLYREKVIVSR